MKAVSGLKSGEVKIEYYQNKSILGTGTDWQRKAITTHQRMVRPRAEQPNLMEQTLHMQRAPPRIAPTRRV